MRGASVHSSSPGGHGNCALRNLAEQLCHGSHRKAKVPKSSQRARLSCRLAQWQQDVEYRLAPCRYAVSLCVLETCFFHEYGRRVGGVPRSSWEGWKLCILVRGANRKNRKSNTNNKNPKQPKTKPASGDPNNECGQSFALYCGETCET